MNTSSLFHLNLSDLAKGVAVIVIGAVLGALQQAVSAHGLDVTAYDWNGILQFAVAAGFTYLTKNFLSNSDGKVLGAIG